MEVDLHFLYLQLDLFTTKCLSFGYATQILNYHFRTGEQYPGFHFEQVSFTKHIFTKTVPNIVLNAEDAELKKTIKPLGL